MFNHTIADAYDSYFDSRMGSFVDQSETRCAFGLLEPNPAEVFLDVGCGTGVFALKLARRGVGVTGIDISEAMLAVAYDKMRRAPHDVRHRISFCVMDAHSLDFGNDTFDGALAVATLAFVDNPQRVFDEMTRVVKPGGRLLVGFLNRESAWGDLYLALAQRGDPVFSQASLLTLDQVRAFDPKNLVATQGCLFLPPDASEDDIGWERERYLSRSESPGFLCALWRKPG